jgi:hypothetical protein
VAISSRWASTCHQYRPGSSGLLSVVLVWSGATGMTTTGRPPVEGRES